MAARAALQERPRHAALGASLALHGALACAALLPALNGRPPSVVPGPTTAVTWLASIPAEPSATPEVAPLVEEQAPPQPMQDMSEAMPEIQMAADHAAIDLTPPTVVPELPTPNPVSDQAAIDPAPSDVAPDIPAPDPVAVVPPAPILPARTSAAPVTQTPPRPPSPAPRPASNVARTERSATAAAHSMTATPTSGIASGQAVAAMASNAAPGPILVTAPRYRSPPAPPVYPPRAVELGLTGTVLVRVRLTPDGATEETRLWRTSGHALLDAAALAAVRRWAFEPASIDGRRVEAWVEVPVHFRLN